PDNRRPVEYNLLEKSLTELNEINKGVEWKSLWDNRADGKIKTWFIKQFANARKNNPELFNKGRYQPVEVRGALKNYVLAFVREYKREWILVVIPLHTAAMEDGNFIDNTGWSETYISLPLYASSAFNVIKN